MAAYVSVAPICGYPTTRARHVAVQANIDLRAIAYKTIAPRFLDKSFSTERHNDGGTGGAERKAILVRVLRTMSPSDRTCALSLERAASTICSIARCARGTLNCANMDVSRNR